MSRIAVFLPGDLVRQKPHHYMGRLAAVRLLAEKQAFEIDHAYHKRAIVLGDFNKHSAIPCGQESAYERFGIEKFPSLCVGGLTRTESRPYTPDRFKGARVGHG